MSAGAPAGLLALTVLSRDWSPFARNLVWVLASLTIVAAVGVVPATRRVSVLLANALLGAGLPAPVLPAGSGWPTRLRTSVWLMVHVVVGTAVVVVVGGLVGTAVTLLLIWVGPDTEVITWLGTTVHVRPGLEGMWAAVVPVVALVLAGQVGVGTAAGLRRLASALLGHRRAEHLAALEAQMTELAHRNRLARELHDSIGHTLTGSTIQAAVARELITTDPDSAAQALTSIEESSRSALDDLDHVLGVLREDTAPTSPQRTLDGLPDLVARVRSTGTPVDVRISGDLSGVPATVSREAYRVAQEGLTNAMRHSERAPVTLRVAVSDMWLEIDVTNPVSGGRVESSIESHVDRNGLVGIAERVRTLAGDVLCAGPEASAGADSVLWRLWVRLPIRSSP